MTTSNWAATPFHERQRLWTGFERTFIQPNGRQERPNIWHIRVEGNRVFTKHGLQGGAMQETDYQGKAKNVGRANAITAEQDAIAEARRDARKKWEFEGYDEVWGGVNIDHRTEGLSIQHMLTSLPGSFCVYKPENDFYAQKKLEKLARAGKAWYTLKRDGMAILVVVDYFGNVQIYSRRARLYHNLEGPTELPDGTLDYSTAIPWSARFGYLVNSVKELKLPPGTLLAGELVPADPNKGDDFKYVASITKSLTVEAVAKMEQQGRLALYLWDIPFYNGEDMVSLKPYKERYDLMRKLFVGIGGDNAFYVTPVTTVAFDSPEAAVEYAKQMGYEGWVVVDPEASYGDKGWNLKGKPDRPSICAKLKPSGEDDFIAMWDPNASTKQKPMGSWGTGKNEVNKLVTLPSGQQAVHGGVGAVSLYQYNNKGELVYISDCSSGMMYEFQAQLRKENFPMVWKVEYKGRTYISEGEKTNALRHPTFLAVRTDKALEECVNDSL